VVPVGSVIQFVYLQEVDAIEMAELDVEQVVTDLAASGAMNEDLGFLLNLNVGLIKSAQERVRDGRVGDSMLMAWSK
jgi:hypothetical protein